PDRVKAFFARVDQAAGLVGAFAFVSHARGDEGQASDLLAAAVGVVAAGRDRPPVQRRQRAGEAALGVAAGADVGGEQLGGAAGALDRVDAVDELLAVVGPPRGADRLAPDQREEAVDVRPD